uniref:Uncharacterized protein n=1 Tax=viral metagenome TaxID=1070528 RepID=A0A6C0JA49_9ZZZZ
MKVIITSVMFLILGIIIYWFAYHKTVPITQYGGSTIIDNADTTINESMICKKDLPPARKFYKKLYHSRDYGLNKKQHAKVIGPTPEPTRDHQSHPAPYPRQQRELDMPSLLDNNNKKEGNYYKSPSDMSKLEQLKFKEKAKFHNMTTIDYANWLMLFKENPENLSGFHRANLRIVLRGGKLVSTDLPQDQKLPNNASHEYTNTILKGETTNIPQPEYLGYLPYNYDEEAPGDKVHNRNLRHLDYINPDEPYKTWILTRKGTGKHKNEHNIPI